MTEAAQGQDPAAEDQTEAGQGPGDSEDLEFFEGKSTDELKRFAAAMRKDKQKANAEARTFKAKAAEADKLKAQMDKLLAAEAKRKEAEMTELDREKARAAQAEQKLAEQQAKFAVVTRQASALEAGVAKPYLSFVANELAAAQEADTETDTEAWFAEFKREHPAFFAGQSGPAPSTGQGGPPPANGGGGKRGQLASVESRIAELRAQGRSINQEGSIELVNLIGMRSRLRAELGT